MNVLFLILFGFYGVKAKTQAEKWVHELRYVDHQTTYDLMLYKPSIKPWQAILVTYNGEINETDTTYLNIQTDQGMLLGEFSFYTENSGTFLKYAFNHHNANVVTQVFNVSIKNPEPVEFYWHPKTETLNTPVKS